MNDQSNQLALLGGTPIRPQGPPAWPIADDDVLAAMERAYRDGSWGRYHGPHVAALQERVAQLHGSSYCLTCSSGTLAVEVALRALNLASGDEVIMAAYDYGGNFLSIHAAGLVPVLVDVAEDNWNLDPRKLESAVGPRTRVILASHLHGGMVPIADVVAFARPRGIFVIEDAAQMPGATYQGRVAGAWGDMGVVSFGGSKLLTAGRGGAVVTSDARLHQRARSQLLRGNNVVAPMSELQAAVLAPQLDKLASRNRLRAERVAVLRGRFATVGVRLFGCPSSDASPGYYKVGIQFDAEQAGLPRRRFVEALRAEGIAADEGFAAVHIGRSPSRYKKGVALTEAERAHGGAVVLHHPVLLEPESAIEEIAIAVEKVQSHAKVLASSDAHA